MFERIGNLETEEKIHKYFSYLKYVLIGISIIILYFLIRNFIHTYSDTEKEMIELAKNYIKDNNIAISGDYYIALGDLGEVEGAELCYNTSGVIVTKNKNKLNFQTYLKCIDHETTIVRNKEKYITLSGDTITILNAGEIYEEKGFYTEDDVEVKTTGIVSQEPGIYTITYDVYMDGKKKETLYRKVIITKYDKNATNSGVKNVDVPSLTLLGNSTMILEKNERFYEPGYKAVDYKDGKISRQVEVSGKVNSSKIGIYIVNYSVTNSRSKKVTKTRVVRVVEEKSDLVIDHKIEKLSSGFVVNLKITGSGYKQTILPDGSKTSNTVFSYPIKSNGIYSFAVYDVEGNVNVREVDVNDIDITGPTGNCIANVNLNKTAVVINATDKSGISGYNFIVDGVASDFVSSLSYETATTGSKVIGQVKDTYGNVTTMTCQVNDISRTVGTMTNGVMNIPLYLQYNYTTPIYWGTHGKTSTVKRSGCGPTSVSMIITYFTGNVSQNPQSLFEWLNSLNYYHGAGFGQAALSKAAKKYGVTCRWRGLNEEQLKATILAGNPIIAFMGPGAFTTGGHYIVLKGVTSDGKILVNDPNSEKRSKQAWDPQIILSQSVTNIPFAVCHL